MFAPKTKVERSLVGISIGLFVTGVAIIVLQLAGCQTLRLGEPGCSDYLKSVVAERKAAGWLPASAKQVTDDATALLFAKPEADGIHVDPWLLRLDHPDASTTSPTDDELATAGYSLQTTCGADLPELKAGGTYWRHDEVTVTPQ